MLMTCQAESHNMTVEAQAQNEVQLTPSPGIYIRIKESTV